MNRQTFLKTLGCVLASSVLQSCSPEKAPPKRPNILFLFTDDQRFDTIRALGNKHIMTPSLDSLVINGTTFTNAYIMGGTSPAVCAPSRAMLLTGRTLFKVDKQGLWQYDIMPENPTLPETFRKAGYTTFGTGKWHNGQASYSRSFSAGDTIFFGGMSDHFRVPWCDFDPLGNYPAGDDLKDLRKKTASGEKGKHSSELFSDSAINFLRNYQSDKPFFMYISYTAPHDPREMPEEFRDMYDTDTIPLPANFLPEHPFDNGELKIRDELLEAFPRTPDKIRRHIADYYAMITHLDSQIGRVLKTLEDTGYAENTIIVFAGDNGLAVGQHGLLGKQNVYEYSVHVPLILSGPGIPAGEKRDAFVYLQDIFPTLCNLTGIPVPTTVEGIDLVPALCDENEKIRDTLSFAYMDYQRAVRDERYKLIEYAVNGKRTTQLFDLKNDPWETHNLAGDPAFSEHQNRLRKELIQWRDRLGDTSPFWEAMGSTFSH
ncbi:sulfatase-like hydrolase/transferase [Candidatus Omnitrophota bacterium]